MTSYSKYNLEIFQTTELLSKAAAKFIVATAKKTIATNGRFIISLSGGKTPQKLYSLLAQPDFSDRIDWEKIHFFWRDERCVSLDDEQNNANQAISSFLSKVNIPKKNIHRIPVNLLPAE